MAALAPRPRSPRRLAASCRAAGALLCKGRRRQALPGVQCASPARRLRVRAAPTWRRRRIPRPLQIWVDCGKIVQDLLKNQQTKMYFGEPVKESYVPSYYSVIKNPMDLGSIKGERMGDLLERRWLQGAPPAVGPPVGVEAGGWAWEPVELAWHLLGVSAPKELTPVLQSAAQGCRS